MWNLSQIQQDDLESISHDPAINWDALSGHNVVVTGATGLIGSLIVKALLYYGIMTSKYINVIALIRSPEKARQILGKSVQDPHIKLIPWNAGEPLQVQDDVDYIIHCASQTSSSAFVNFPVETIQTAYAGTEAVLEFAKAKQIKKMVYLSTMEVYGTPQTDDKICESFQGQIDPIVVRNCYPESKRMCENLCVSYAMEYHVPITIARLTQTFGPGVQKSDRRVFAEFARCVIEQRDIVLLTKGETKRSYLYTADAVRGILILLLRGKSGEAYNLANEDTYCSIYEMAKLVADDIAHGTIGVSVQENENVGQRGFAPVLHMNLDTTKAQQLGWRPEVSLKEAYQRMFVSMSLT